MDTIEEKKKSHPIRTLFFLLILIIILIYIYGKFLGNSGLIIKEYNIFGNNIPDSFNNVKIAHFADTLINNNQEIDILDEVIQKINDKKVDIIIFSGNLTKKTYKLDEAKANLLIKKLSKLSSKYGKYYVSGEYDKSNPSYDNIMQQSGFVSLNDNKDIIISKTNESILIVGLDYNSSTEFIKDTIKDNNFFKMVAFSESDEIEEIKDYNFDLAIASNSLNGQINLPFVKDFFLKDGSKKYYEPYYKVNSTDYYISSGIGTDLIDYRLFNRPSINIYKLTK